MFFYINLLLFFIFAFLRFTLPFKGEIVHDDIFKDIAHIFVGYLFGIGIKYRWGWVLGLIISLLEVAAFFLSRM